ncbi:hypothetical protein QQF64_002736 [Cirrhinus molitorella]
MDKITGSNAEPIQQDESEQGDVTLPETLEKFPKKTSVPLERIPAASLPLTQLCPSLPPLSKQALLFLLGR